MDIFHRSISYAQWSWNKIYEKIRVGVVNMLAFTFESNFIHDVFESILIERELGNKIQVFRHIFSVTINRHCRPTG